MDTVTLLNTVIKALKKYGARVTGSYARGEETPDSDYDFYIPLAKWQAFVKHAPAGWTSCVIGCITWNIESIQIEASFIFQNQRKNSPKNTGVLPWRILANMVKSY